MKINNIFTMLFTTILVAMATTTLGANTTRRMVEKDSISSVIYESAENRYLGDEETGCYVNDGSLDF